MDSAQKLCGLNSTTTRKRLFWFWQILTQPLGFYCPEKWEDTTYKKSSYGVEGWKNIVSGKLFLFYCLDDQILIIKHRDNKLPFILSEKLANDDL